MNREPHLCVFGDEFATLLLFIKGSVFKFGLILIGPSFYYCLSQNFINALL